MPRYDHLKKGKFLKSGCELSKQPNTCDDPSITLQKTVNLIGKMTDYCKNSEKSVNSDIFASEPEIIAATGAFRGEIGNNINYLLQVRKSWKFLFLFENIE